MRRLHAFALLLTLLVAPSSMLASVVFAAQQCCCCTAKMCPMHRAPDASGRKLCGTAQESAPKCSCGMSHPNALPLMIFSVEQATMARGVSLQILQPKDSALPSAHQATLLRASAPPERPPRS